MSDVPAISLVIPLYNEEDNVRSLVATLGNALERAGLVFELLLVDNGSSDATGRLVDELCGEDPRLRKVSVTVNEGYGHGILRGLAEARGRHLAFMCGDLQVSEGDVVRILTHAIEGRFDLCKASRVERHDGAKRKFFSFALNKLVPLVFATLGRDVNGTPKVMTRELYSRLDLESKRWFIDAEIMIKATAMPGIRIAEVPVVFRARREGRSAVRCLPASLEFLREMARYRMSDLSRFRGAVLHAAPEREPGEGASSPALPS